MIRSMTGFGRAECADVKRKLTVEMKAVNNRYLDFNIRLPRKYNFLESQVRNVLKEYVQRGKVDVFINEETYETGEGALTCDFGLAEAYAARSQELADRLHIAFDLTASDFLRLPDIYKVREPETSEEELWAMLEPVVRGAAENFNEARALEGEKLKKDIISKLEGMRGNVKAIQAMEPEILDGYRQKLTAKVEELLGERTLEESQIASAVVIYADKISTDEETVRLLSHIDQMIAEFDKEESIGRKLDFLTQEMNREANTTLSKAGNLATSNIGIALKTDIEKIREQIQNIE